MSMPLLQPWQRVCKSRTVCFFPAPSRGGKHMNIDKRESLGFKVVGQVCNIFHRLFFDVSCCPSRVVNGPRMASEATTPCLVLKYRKNEALDFYAQFRLFSAGFPPGKVETSDFSTTKYGGFAQKVRRFVPKKSDIFVPVLCIFHVFLGIFFIFLPQYSKCSADVNFYIHCQIDSLRWQNAENSAKIRSRRDTMPCQNF